MFGHIIRHLLDNKQTTIKEIEEVTGRLTSDLPVVINWTADDAMTDVDTGDARGGHETIHLLTAGKNMLNKYAPK